MSNQYHAGQKYTNAQKEQLDAAFSAWIDADSYAENAPDGIYSDEGRNLAALILFNAYDALRAQFAAANAQAQGNNGEPKPDPWAFRRYVDDNYVDDDGPYMHSHDRNGY